MNDVRMSRAWRNRSPVTQGKWVEFAVWLGLDRSDARLLYAACGEVCTGDTFDWDQLNELQQWITIERVRLYATNVPTKAMSRGEFDASRHNQV